MSGFRPRFFVPGPDSGADVSTGPGGAGSGPVGGAGAASGALAGAVITLDAEDSYHALRVLRLRPGDECEVVVGAAVYAATVLSAASSPSGKMVQVRLEGALGEEAAGAHYRFTVTLVQAVIRPSALDWSIEKSTETGASLILLVQAAGSPGRSRKDSERPARWARIAREAAKQSKQPAVPAVEMMSSLEAAVDRVRGLGLVSILLDPRADAGLYDLVAGHPPAPDGSPGVALWVGPEGGWTDEERRSLAGAGTTVARLGGAVLRTETAGPVAVAVARLALGDW